MGSGTTGNIGLSVDATKSGLLATKSGVDATKELKFRAVSARPRNPLGDIILRLIPKDFRAPFSDELEFPSIPRLTPFSDEIEFPSSVRTKTDFGVPHQLFWVNFTASCIAREGAIDAIMTAVYARRLCRVPQDRLSNPLMAVFGAPGSGKSFFIDILGERFGQGQETHRESFLDGSVVLAISFNGVCSTPAEVDLTRNAHAQFALGARALWSYFVNCSTTRISDFEGFYNFLLSAVPRLSLDLAIQCVRAHSGNNRILLLVDELIKADIGREGRAVSVLSHIGEILSADAEFNAVVTSLKPGPFRSIQTKFGRPIVWISLPPFNAEESEAALSAILIYPILEDPALSELNSMVKLCISDVGGHPRSLEILNNVLLKELVPSVEPKCLQEAVVRQFSEKWPAIAPLEAVKVALRGRPVALNQMVGHQTVEEHISYGVFLNSEVSINKRAEDIVPRSSIMQIRSIKRVEQEDLVLMRCLNAVVLQKRANFQPEELEVFHGNWEVMIRRLGVSGQMNLAEFYSRSLGSEMKRPVAASQVMIDFSQKPDGLLRFDDARSAYRSGPGQNTDYFWSCRAVFLGAPRQPGFGLFTIERKASGDGYVVIFVNNKYSNPSAKSTLDEDDLNHCWKGCKGFLGNPVFEDLKITAADCFLVMAAWRTIELEQQNLNSRIIVLGREDLAELYTPSLITRPQFIMRSKG